MAHSNESESLRRLINVLRDDWTALNGKYPDQALFALGDRRVQAALESRFEAKDSLKHIKALSYNFETGLNGIYFEFSSENKPGEIVGRDTFLVLMDGQCAVAAIVDPFDPERPNAFTPPLSSPGEQPFVLSRPSVTTELAFGEGDLASIRMRSREYFQKLIAPGGGGDVEIYTTCTYYTQTNLGRDHYNDRNTDDCGLPGPILA